MLARLEFKPQENLTSPISYVFFVIYLVILKRYQEILFDFILNKYNHALEVRLLSGFEQYLIKWFGFNQNNSCILKSHYERFNWIMVKSNDIYHKLSKNYPSTLNWK